MCQTLLLTSAYCLSQRVDLTAIVGAASYGLCYCTAQVVLLLYFINPQNGAYSLIYSEWLGLIHVSAQSAGWWFSTALSSSNTRTFNMKPLLNWQRNCLNDLWDWSQMDYKPIPKFPFLLRNKHFTVLHRKHNPAIHQRNISKNACSHSHFNDPILYIYISFCFVLFNPRHK